MEPQALSPLIINLAPTGMIPTRQQSPFLPLSPDEISEDVRGCVALGVSMVHLHAREVDGIPSTNPEIFAEIIEKIRTHTPDLVIVTTTSGRQTQDIQARAATLYLQEKHKPDMASLTLGSMNFSQEASINSPASIMRLAEIMLENNIRPELEVFDLGMIHFAKILADKGLIKPPFYFNILLGNPSTAQVNLTHVSAMINDLPPGSIWSLGGIGRFQAKANALGVVLADGVRVGLEDNIWMDAQRTRHASNRLLVERILLQTQALERPVASCQEVRRLLQLPARACQTHPLISDISL
jgi:uncharacterized protein (DUF849 family)